METCADYQTGLGTWLTLRNASTVLEHPAVMMTSLEWMWSSDWAAMFEALEKTKTKQKKQQQNKKTTTKQNINNKTKQNNFSLVTLTTKWFHSNEAGSEEERGGHSGYITAACMAGLYLPSNSSSNSLMASITVPYRTQGEQFWHPSSGTACIKR